MRYRRLFFRFRMRSLALVALAMALGRGVASADSFVYVVTSNQQFGTLDVNTGGFAAIGPNLPVGVSGLVPGSNGSLLTLGNNGDLYSINQATGVTTLIGPTGLSDCSTATSPCGLGSANTLGELAGTVYATDFAEKLYAVNGSNGQLTKVGATGMPPITFVPLSTPNPDGSLNFFDSSLFSGNGKLYGTFYDGTVNFSTGAVTITIPDSLYSIDPSTGATTGIPLSQTVGEASDVNGTFYAFDNQTGQVFTLDVADGNTTFVSNLSPTAGLIFGSTPTPEPASLVLFGTGLLGLGMILRRKLRSQAAEQAGAA